MTVAVNLGPIPLFSAHTGSGAPLIGGKLWTYLDGGSTPAPTYTDSTGGTANSNPVILNARGEAAVYLVSGQAYKYVLEDFAVTTHGTQLWTQDNITGINDIAATFSGSGGSALIGFIQAGAGAVVRTVQSKLRDIVNAADFGAKFDGVTDDTAAIVAAMTAVFNAGGGTVQCPAGTAMVTSIAFTWSGIGTTVNISGSGTLATYFKKIDSSTTPIFNLTTAGIVGVYVTLEDFTVEGANTFVHDGIVATRIGYVKTRNLRIIQCNNGWNSLGCLITTHYNLEVFTNVIGVLMRKSVDLVYSNLVQFIGGVIKSNTTFGMDLGECNSISLFGTDIESNGTSGNTATGAIRLRSTVAAEFGDAVFSLQSCWFELNNGDNFVVEAASNVDLSIRDTLILFSQAARGLNVGAIRSLIMENTQVDGATVGAAAHTVIGGEITTLTTTATNKHYIGASINGVTYTDFTSNIVLEPLVASILSGAYSNGQRIVYFKDAGLAGADTLSLYHVNGTAANVAACAAAFAASSTTSRSINAGGTVNASGADYAEYETKSPTCGEIAKGSLVGFNRDGLLTDKFSESVSFAIKSTSPAYVGGDAWFNEVQAQQNTPEWDAQQDRHAASRARVDRIAYSGKVPVNIQGARPGDYIDAAQGEGDTIVGMIAAQRSDATVGRVLSVGADGRPTVKVT